MSFGQKPSAWARPQGSAQPQQLNPNLFTNQLGLTTAGQPFSSIPGIPVNSGLLVNQAAFTNMNTVLAQAQRQMLPQQIQPQQRSAAPSTPQNRSHRSFVGVVTKLMETYGFVDEDVFFQTNVIRGAMPRVGDRVMVEANYNPSMPFKWNARSIEKMAAEYRQEPAHQQQQQQQPTQQYQSQQNRQAMQNGAPTRWGERISSRDELSREPRRPVAVHRSPPPREQPPARHPPSRQRSPPSRRSPPSSRQSATKRERERESRNELETRERDRESTRARSPHSSKRDSVSPPRRRQRIIPRYHCNVPKQTLPGGEQKCFELRKRYPSLYIPSDFIRCKFDWIESIKVETPLNFSPHPINFHILHKDVDVPLGEGEQLPPENPPDADSRFVVKILLISHPGLSALRRKISGLLPDGSIDESTETQPLAKNIQLLVGYRGKGELMCIGGAWSPSLDGKNPLDPQTIVKTAIRTVHSLTGIDLSGCAKWYKMLHLRYFRPERSRVDSCVLMLPDTSSVPAFQISEEQYQQAELTLQNQLAAKLSAIDEEEFVPPNSEKANEKGSNELCDGAAAENTVTPTEAGAGGEDQQGKNAEAATELPQIQAPSATESTETAAELTDGQGMTLQSEQTTNEAQEIVATKKKNGKTHWSILEPNIKAMKVAELRDELEARQLESKGVKNVLMQRLQEAIEKEKAEDKATDKSVPNADSQQNEMETDTQQQEQQQKENTGEKQSIVVQIKEEIIELMETDEVSESGDKKESEKEAQEKAEKEKKELEKAKEKFEKEKKEKKLALERHYGQIPKNEPGIFVYPSKTAKSGKFDCKLMSLHSLMEYNKEHDNKESSFEVFLFAEALREAFDRSHAFIVYHTLSTALDRDSEKKRRNETLSEACKDDEVVVLDEGSNKKEEKEGSKSKSPTNIDLRTNFKALVNDFDAFMAFSYFEPNICSYIIDKDLEEIIHYIGLDLSRWDVQHLVKKVSSKERVTYRDFTDKWVDKEGNLKYAPTATYDNLFHSYSEHAKIHNTMNEEMEGDARENITEMSVTQSGIVYFEGALINIKQSIEHQNAMEKERQEIKDKNDQLELHLGVVKEQKDYLEKKKKRLEEDVDRYKKKLYDTEKHLKKEQDDNGAMKIALQDCKRYGERLIGTVEKIFPPPPKKEEKEKAKESAKEKDEDVVVLEGVNGTEKDKDGSRKEESAVDKLLAMFKENGKKGEERKTRAGSV